VPQEPEEEGLFDVISIRSERGRLSKRKRVGRAGTRKVDRGLTLEKTFKVSCGRLTKGKEWEGLV